MKIIHPLLFVPFVLFTALSLSISLNHAYSSEEIARSDSFKYSVNIEYTETENIQKLEIPEAIHSLLENKDASDLQVFDSEAKMIPTHIEFIGAPEQTEMEMQLAYFPITQAKDAQQVDSNSLKFNYADGKIEVLLDENVEINNLQTIGFIFENPLALKEVPENLKDTYFSELIIIPDESFTGSAGLVLKTSDDLNTWSTLSSTEKIVNITFMEQRLVKNRVSVPANASRFIMLTWDGSIKPEVQSLSGTFKEKSTLPPYQWTRIDNLKPVADEKNQNRYEFELSPAFRSTAFRIQNIKSNEIFSGVLQNKIGEKEDSWGAENHFTFYKIPNGSDYLEDTQGKVLAYQKNNWRITFDYPQEKIDIENLFLEFNRHPINIYFLPSGTPPYHLKFGRQGNNDSAQPKKLAEAIQVLIKDENTKLSESNFHVNSIERLENNSVSINWKKLFLWATLVAGVAVMAWMARSVFKSLGQSQ